MHDVSVTGMKPHPFPLGTLVKLRNPHPNLHAMIVGKVVPHRGKHSPVNIRIRWSSGWGITSNKSDLIALTPEEIKIAPPIPVVDIDLYSELNKATS